MFSLRFQNVPHNYYDDESNDNDSTNNTANDYPDCSTIH